MNNQQLKPTLSALLAATLMILITTILPMFFKTWFVYESGNFRFLPAFGPVLAFGLMMRWPVRKLSIGLFAVGCCVSMFSLIKAEPQFQAGYTLLLLLQIVLIGLLLGNPIKTYFQKDQEIGRPSGI